MAWEYLDDPALEGRCQLVAGYLAARVAGRHILDLNCGQAPLLRWLPATWRRYIGNDIRQDVIAALNERHPAGTWLCCSDDALPVFRQVDILVVLGYAARVSGCESATLDESVKRIVGRYWPSVVILEAWLELPEVAGLRPLVNWLVAWGYKLTWSWRIEPAGGVRVPYERRQVHILEWRV